jgi:hypothetical protein
MTGDELKAIRLELGLSLQRMGLALYPNMNKNSRSVRIRQFESEALKIPDHIAVRAYALGASSIAIKA